MTQSSAEAARIKQDILREPVFPTGEEIPGDSDPSRDIDSAEIAMRFYLDPEEDSGILKYLEARRTEIKDRMQATAD